jgi:hypothetical protein
VTHPLRQLAKDLMALGQENPNWSQVSVQFSHLSDYCQLLAGLNEAHEREYQLVRENERLRAVISRGVELFEFAEDDAEITWLQSARAVLAGASEGIGRCDFIGVG